MLPRPAEPAPKAASAPLSATATPKEASGDVEADAKLANEVFDELAAKYELLDGVKVVMGETPKGEEAVAYYTAGEIVIDRDHTVSIEKILAHEIWHVIDWRDNGRLDWGEDLPPVNQSDYL
jgi:hypothetical protein